MKTDLDSIDKIVSDPEQVRQIIWNILLNALDALSGKGSIFISTRSVNADSHGEKGIDMVEITVRDSGEGFSEKALAQMFSPFFTQGVMSNSAGVMLPWL